MGQMATDMLIVKQSETIIATVNKTYIKPLNKYTAVVIN